MRANVESPEARAVGKNRLRATIFFALAIVAGLAGLLLFMRYMDRIKGALPGGATIETVPVVVAAIDLPIATRLEEKQLAVVKWPKEHVPQGANKEIKAVINRTLRRALVKGEAVLNSRLADDKHGQGMAALLKEGLRAMAVKVDAVVGVAGFVKPGDYVDVITTMRPDKETEEDLDYDAARISKIILQNILVLAVGEHLETGGRKPVAVKVVTLGVTPEQSERLALGSQHGKISLTMRTPIDQDTVPTAGITPVMLLAPDEGAVMPEVEQVAKDTSTSQRRRRRKKVEIEEKPEPEQPVVEILRGNRIEERKLRIPESGD